MVVVVVLAWVDSVEGKMTSNDAIFAAAFSLFSVIMDRMSPCKLVSRLSPSVDVNSVIFLKLIFP